MHLHVLVTSLIELQVLVGCQDNLHCQRELRDGWHCFKNWLFKCFLRKQMYWTHKVPSVAENWNKPPLVQQKTPRDVFEERVETTVNLRTNIPPTHSFDTVSASLTVCREELQWFSSYSVLLNEQHPRRNRRVWFFFHSVFLSWFYCWAWKQIVC